jgi:hypothetical protein
MITTVKLPLALKSANDILRKTPNHRTVSALIEEAEGRAAVSSVSTSEDISPDSVPVPVVVDETQVASKGSSALVYLQKVGKALEVAQPYLVAALVVYQFTSGRRKKM